MTLSAAGQGGSVSSYLRVERGGTVFAEALAVTDGEVSMDRRAAVRRSAKFTIQDPDWAPFDVADALAPIGTEVTIFRTLGDNVWSLGVFRVDDVQIVDDGAQLATEVTAFDRSRAVAEARLETSVVFPSGTNALTAITQLVQDALPGVAVLASAVDDTLPLVVLDAQSDPWAEITRIAESIGRECFFDDAGSLVVQPEPTTSGPPPATVYADGPGGSLTTFGLRWNREGVYNAVVAVGDAPDGQAPAYGVARDEDPSSPTYYFGTFGRKPRFYASELLTSDAQAVTAARAILARNIGVPRSLTFGGVPDPGLRPSQVVTVRRSARNIDEAHIVETVTIPLGPTAMQNATTRTTTA